MKLTDNDLLQLSQLAITAAKRAGALIAKKSQFPPTVQKKKGGDQLASQVVTEVDYLSQALILQHLLPSCERYDLALLTEESDDDKLRLEKDYFWCIDPLDGTLPFTESTPGYAVSIALLSRSGEPLIGVVYDSVEERLYTAVKGQGAYRNGRPWLLPSVETLKGRALTLICDRSLTQHERYPAIIKQAEERAVEQGLLGLNIINQGGAVMNACWVIEQAPALYFKPPKPQEGGGSLWDFAATACLFNELGASVSDIYGQPLDLNRVDSTFMNHRGVIFGSSSFWQQQVSRLINL
jgi:fructose-1,6-bisphosphatase/inositol monophosphatase family enzyme